MEKEEVEIVEEDVKPLMMEENEENEDEINSWTRRELLMLENPEISPVTFTSVISLDEVGVPAQEIFRCEMLSMMRRFDPINCAV